jgi:FlaA1/EpsC-like NDP-sugar epimerase
VSGVYRSDWQTFSLHEAKRIVAGATVGVVCLAVVLVAGFGLGFGAMITLVLHWGAAVLALTGSRGVVRALSDALRPVPEDGEPTLVYGAGSGGELALRELQANTRLGLRVVGFLDDNAIRHRSVLHGVEVLGGIESLETAARTLGVRCIVLSTAKIRPEVLGHIQAVADDLHLGLYRMSIEFHPVAGDEEPLSLPALATVPAARRGVVDSHSG